MSDQHHKGEDSLVRLLRSAMPAPELDEGEVEAIRSAAGAAWHRKMAEGDRAAGLRPRLQRPRVWATAALAIAAFVAIGFWRLVPRPGASPPVPIASVESILGEVSVANGALLAVDTWVRTGPDGHVALRTLAATGEPGVQLRLDVDSSLRLMAYRRVELERGAVYVDTGRKGAAGAEPAIEVLTPLGRVQDVGTRFEIRWLPGEGGVRLRVRDGEVIFTSQDLIGPTSRQSARAGTELKVRPDGEVERVTTQIRGDSWDWVYRAAPPFDLDGKSLDDFLGWLESEAGLSVRFDDPALAVESRAVILHGSLEGIEPREALRLVLLGAGLRADFTDFETHGEVRIEAEDG